jgi:hypothetical protein
MQRIERGHPNWQNKTWCLKNTTNHRLCCLPIPCLVQSELKPRMVKRCEKNEAINRKFLVSYDQNLKIYFHQGGAQSQNKKLNPMPSLLHKWMNPKFPIAFLTQVLETTILPQRFHHHPTSHAVQRGRKRQSRRFVLSKQFCLILSAQCRSNIRDHYQPVRPTQETFSRFTVTVRQGPKHSSSGSTVCDYGLDDRSSIPDRGRGFFF